MTSTSRPGAEPILLAFSGGLDTSFCVPWLKETYQRPVITVTVDTGGIDAAAAQSLAERSQKLGASRTSSHRCAHALFRAGAQISADGQCAPRRGISALRRRGARAAGADDRANGVVARDQNGGARVHGGRQRPGAVRSGAAHLGPGPRDHCAGARPRVQAAGTIEVSRRSSAADSALWRGLFGEPRIMGGDHRRQGNADFRGQYSG